MQSQKWTDALKGAWRWSLTKVIAPLLRGLGGTMLRWAAALTDSRDSSGPWKQQAMEDFGAWLAALPDKQPGDEPGLEACDLYTVLTEFAALRQEIKLQNRQQRTAVRDQETLAERLQAVGTQFEERLARLDRLHDALRRDIEVKAVLPFLDIRDALVRGEAAARETAGVRGFWHRPPKGIDAVVEGYAMALRRFDRSLNLLGVVPIATIDQPFDAACMRAVDKRWDAEKEPGIVVEEILGGFVRGEEVLREAEVVVNSK